ncbi:MAG: hypothetical protein WBH45_21905, partial [Acidobacteriaceae bacterium]
MDIFPGNEFCAPLVERDDAALNLVAPGLFNIRILGRIETIEEKVSQGGARISRELECFVEKLCGFTRHK